MSKILSSTDVTVMRGEMIHNAPACVLTDFLALAASHEALRMRVEDPSSVVSDDLTLRDRFALAALTGYLAQEHEGWSSDIEDNVELAYRAADAMLCERSGEAQKAREAKRVEKEKQRKQNADEVALLEQNGFRREWNIDGDERWTHDAHREEGQMTRGDALGYLSEE